MRPSSVRTPSHVIVYNAQRALELLRVGSGHPDAAFREDQEDAIRHVVEGTRPAAGRAEDRLGQELRLLHRDQAAARSRRRAGAADLAAAGADAQPDRGGGAHGRAGATINSDNQDEWADVEAAIARDEVDILLISPERLANERFRTRGARAASRHDLAAGDRRGALHLRLGPRLPAALPACSERIVRTLPPNLRLLATTATANNRVMDDLDSGARAESQRLARRPESPIAARCRPSACRARPSVWPGWPSTCPRCPGHGIIYTLTVRDAVQVADWLEVAGLQRGVLHRRNRRSPRRAGAGAARQSGEGAGRDDGARDGLRQAGPGVRHPLPDAGLGRRLLPAGRPRGRALDAAYGVLLSGEEETDITDCFIDERLSDAGGSRARCSRALESGAGRSVRSRAAGAGQPQQGPHRQDDRAAVARIAGAHRQAGHEMAAHGREPERGILGASGAADRACGATSSEQMQDYVGLPSASIWAF